MAKKLAFKNLKDGKKKNVRSAVRLARRSSKRAFPDEPGSVSSESGSRPGKAYFSRLKALALIPLRSVSLFACRLARLFKTRRHLRAALIAGAVLITAMIIIVVTTAGSAPAASAQRAGARIEEQNGGAGGGAYMDAAYPDVFQDILSPGATSGEYVQEQKPTPVPTVMPEPSPTLVKTATPKPSPTATPKPPPDLNDLVEYYMVEADKYYGGYSSNHYDYTEDELHMLAQVITKEAGGESYEGQLAVGNVVMNRVFCGYKNWGSTIESVITAKGQFAYNPDTKPRSSCIKAAADVLKNERWVVPQNTYFFKRSKNPGDNWGSHKFCIEIGHHCFYTDKIGSRSTKDGVPPALYKRVYKWPQYGCRPAKRVSRIQHMLSSLGYKVDQDGYFGKSTKDAIVEFQKDKKLTADGVAGPATLKTLIRAYGVDRYCSKYGI